MATWPGIPRATCAIVAPMTRSRLATPVLCALVALCACAPTPTALPPTAAVPTAAPVTPTQALPPTAEPTATPSATATALSPDTWHQVMPGAGLCTDTPVLLGQVYVGTTSNTLCYPNEAAGIWPSGGAGVWTSLTLPEGTYPTGASRFPPGGGLLITTEAGQCVHMGGPAPDCQSTADGFPYGGVRAIATLGTEPVYLFGDSVAYLDLVYSIPDVLGAKDAHATALAVSRETSEDPEIWVGTDGYGILVVRPLSGTTDHYTAAEGLPSDTIRDLNTGGEYCPKACPDLVDVWVATDRGAGHWDGRAWHIYTSGDNLPADDVLAISSATTGSAYAVTAAGPAHFDGSQWFALPHPTDIAPERILDVAAGHAEVWFGTLHAGLLIYTPGP